MKTVTKESFLDNTHLDRFLCEAVIEQFGGWEDFTRHAPDVTNHGIDGGFNGFIYTVDTEAFAKANRKAIAAMASQQADDFGTPLFEMIRGFGTFRNSEKPTDEEIGSALYAGDNVEDGIKMLNVLAWYAAEEVCRAYVDMTEQD